MDDQQVMARIHDLVDEEHSLRNQHADAPLDDAAAQRLADLEVALDQCWDLLRQRRARREFGEDVDQATVRPVPEVEDYMQ